MRKKLGLAFLLSLGIVATTTLGFSSWVIPVLSFSASPSINDSSDAVAYVRTDGNSDRYFWDLGKAINFANSFSSASVYVIPGVGTRDDPILLEGGRNVSSGRNVVTLSSGVSLYLPFEGENYEHTTMYPNFAKIAEDEGKKAIARLFTAIGKVEIEHEREYLALKKMLEVLDNFERGEKALENVEDCAKCKESFNLVHKQVWDTLSKLGLEIIEAEGQIFDPNFHEAVMQTPTSEYTEHTIINELQKGYKMGDKVLRPSLVNVATAE